MPVEHRARRRLGDHQEGVHDRAGVAPARRHLPVARRLAQQLGQRPQRRLDLRKRAAHHHLGGEHASKSSTSPGVRGGEALEALSARSMARWLLWSAENSPKPTAAAKRAGRHELRDHEGGRLDGLRHAALRRRARDARALLGRL